ncbi:M3 family metallopeptidase [Shigella flexneri]
MRNASLFNKGYEMSELLSAALLDMHWRCREEDEAMQDVDDFELRALVAESGSSCYTATLSQQFCAHIFGGGYAAGYYTFICDAKMLADDGYQWFVEQGECGASENGQRFRKAMLSRGDGKNWNTCIDDGGVRLPELCRCCNIVA